MGTEDITVTAALADFGIAEPTAFHLRLEIECYLDRLETLQQLAPASRQRLSALLRGGQAESDLAALSLAEAETVLDFHPHAHTAEAEGGHFALGSLLLATDQIAHAELATALVAQRTSGKRLGEELIRAGFVTPRQIERGLQLQQSLVALALAAAAALTPVTGTVKMAQAGQGRAVLPVSATVIANARLINHLQPTEMTLTSADLTRGFAVFPLASRFTVVTNSRVGYVIEVQSQAPMFESVQISGLSSVAELGAEGGSIYQRGTPVAGKIQVLSYRFALRPDAVAGTYAWPLQLAVKALD